MVSVESVNLEEHSVISQEKWYIITSSVSLILLLRGTENTQKEHALNTIMFL